MRRTETRSLSPRFKISPPGSILVMRPGAMGDVLLTTPALRALRTAFPRARISVLVTRSGEGILRGNECIDETLVLDKSSLRAQTGIIATVRQKRFDLIIDFLCNPRTALIARLSGAPHRLGYDVRVRKFAYNLRRERDQYENGKKVVKYAAQVNVDMLASLGIEAAAGGLEFVVGAAAQKKMDDYLKSEGIETKKVAGVCPAGTWQAKTWDVEKFAKLADGISKDCGLDVLIFWGPGEQELARRMAGLMRTHARIACETTIEEAGALIRRCSLFLSNDSGLKHVAVAVGTPTVTIFGPTNPGTWNPPAADHRAVFAELDCVFCDKNECADLRCMKELSVEKVLSVAKEVLKA